MAHKIIFQQEMIEYYIRKSSFNRTLIAIYYPNESMCTKEEVEELFGYKFDIEYFEDDQIVLLDVQDCELTRSRVHQLSKRYAGSVTVEMWSEGNMLLRGAR